MSENYDYIFDIIKEYEEEFKVTIKDLSPELQALVEIGVYTEEELLDIAKKSRYNY